MHFLNKIHSERNIDNFTKLDGTVKFYSFVKAAMLRTNAKKVMDFGAGRGEFWYSNSEDDGSLWIKYLQSLKFNDAEVYACDVDPVVLSHPCSDKQFLLKKDSPLPFNDEEFDVIVSDFTFEHIDNPEFIAKELFRVLKNGGYICARTPNKYGYVKIITQLIPNKWHVKLLSYIQPHRKAEDVFPTRYKLNSVRQIRKYFQGCDICYYRDSSEPSYYFGNPLLYRIFQLIHWLVPDAMATSICLFIKKPEPAHETKN